MDSMNNIFSPVANYIHRLEARLHYSRINFVMPVSGDKDRKLKTRRGHRSHTYIDQASTLGLNALASISKGGAAMTAMHVVPTSYHQQPGQHGD